MTSPNTGLRRIALVALAVGAALGASACSAGQDSQTAYQVPAVDGGHGSAGDVYVNDFVVVLPETGSARVGFAASSTGSLSDQPVSLDRVEVDGAEVQVGPSRPIGPGCSLIVSAQPDASPVPAQADLCVEQTTATLADAGDLNIGVAVPAVVTFSNGDRIEFLAAVIAETPASDEYTRPVQPAAEGH